MLLRSKAQPVGLGDDLGPQALLPPQPQPEASALVLLEGAPVVRSLRRGGAVEVDHTASPEFRRWFRESKVVDVSGAPLIVYHGSPVRGFTVFELDKINKNDPDAPYNGFWFSSNFRDAKMSGDHPWARPSPKDGGETRAFYLSLQRPATKKEAYAVARELDFSEGSPYYHLTTQEAVRLELLKRGYDGVIHEQPIYFTDEMRARVAAGEKVAIRGSYYVQKERLDAPYVELYNSGGHVTGYGDLKDVEDYYSTGVYAAFLPNQIKSVENCGAFDPQNPDIYG